MSVETSSPISSVQVLIPQQQWADVKSRLGTAEARLADFSVAMEVATETAGLNRFMALAMALCNILAVRYNARRVSLGILRSRSVHVMAMNQTEKILRKMQLVRDIEEAMEECLDQDTEILFPSAADGNVITRCAAKITSIHGTGTVLAMPLRRDGCVGVLLMEFEPGRNVTSAELAPLRCTATLLTPRIMDLYEYDRWFGARWMRDWRKYLSKLVGPTHTWIKAAAIAITLFLMWAFFAKGTFHIIAPFTLEPVRQAQIVAPFDGYIKTVLVRPGDAIVAHKTVLAELHTAILHVDSRQQRFNGCNLKEHITQMHRRSDAAQQIAGQYDPGNWRSNRGVCDLAFQESDFSQGTVHGIIGNLHIGNFALRLCHVRLFGVGGILGLGGG